MKTHLAALAATCAVLASPAVAQNFGVGVNVGTPGLGLQVSTQVSDLVVLRGALDGASISRDETYSGVDYNGKVKLMTGGVFADLHPGGGALFVSGGAYVGKRKINLGAQPTAAVDIGGQTFTPAEVGRIDGDAKLSNFQPFVGLGFDNTYVGERRWGVRALAGIAFSKRPDVNLTASGGILSNDATLQTRLRAEEVEARDDAKNFKYFPVVQVGLTRRF